MVHIGQGKWYPGEPLPRWALSLFWRSDGKPMWHDESLLGDESKEGKVDKQKGQQFASRLASLLGLPGSFVVPGYEDVGRSA